MQLIAEIAEIIYNCKLQKLQDTQTHHSFRLTLSHLSHPTPTGQNLKLSPTLTNGLSHSITLSLSLHRPYNTHTLTNLHTPPNPHRHITNKPNSYSPQSTQTNLTKPTLGQSHQIGRSETFFSHRCQNFFFVF